MLGLTGFLGLARIPLCFWARADSTLLLGSHGSHRSHSIALWVGNLTDGSACGLVWTVGLHGARSHGFIFRTLRTNQTYRTNRTDWTFLKIIREICGICVRPPWTPCGRVTKLQKIVLFGGRFERFEKKCGKSCYIKKFLQTVCVEYKKWVG